MKKPKAAVAAPPSAIADGVLPVCRALAAVIRRRRERLGLSRNGLAKLSGVSRQMLGMREADTQRRTDGNAMDIKPAGER